MDLTSAADLQSAIAALHGTDADRAALANQWLLGFSASPSALATCVHLLGGERDANVEFFCATILLTRMRADWQKLPDEARAKLTADIRCVH
jgi:hypothetical protein